MRRFITAVLFIIHVIIWWCHTCSDCMFTDILKTFLSPIELWYLLSRLSFLCSASLPSLIGMSMAGRSTTWHNLPRVTDFATWGFRYSALAVWNSSLLGQYLTVSHWQFVNLGLKLICFAWLIMTHNDWYDPTSSNTDFEVTTLQRYINVCSVQFSSVIFSVA